MPLDEDRPSRRFFKADKKLTEFLQQERDAAKQYSEYVFLTEYDSLFIPRGQKFQGNQDEWIANSQWTILEIDQDNDTIKLSRRHRQGIDAPPHEGYLRTRGHYGQIRLIERRKQAIDRLSSHAFLLKTLATQLTSIDTGEHRLPWSHIEDSNVIDENKLAIIKDILRTRPMYALQGPPGTGKSTLVAHLLRQILEDDPMAQILVTSKDHAAVDVLLDKVMGQAYKDMPKEQYPLAIRLNRRDGKDGAKEQTNTLIQTTFDAIESAASTMTDPTHKEIQRIWHDLLKKIKDNQSENIEQDADTQALSNALVDLVRRGASITYCTTSSGDLEELAKGTRSFDWSIIEEAGKTHGFDLALPLQAGHRWLLLGDHKQLRPFLYDEFADCFNRLREEDNTGAIDILDQLRRKKNTRLIDIEWLKEKLNTDDKAKFFPNYALGWLSSLNKIIENRSKFNGIIQDESIGASVGLLTKQYRMPPAIGDLISTVFYQETVSNATTDATGSPDREHCNPFSSPSWLKEKSLIWIDVPWSQENKETKGTGYSNKREQQIIGRLLQEMKLAPDTPPSKSPTVAILTPYNMQKNAINKDASIAAPEGCQFGSQQGRDAGKEKAKAYSIDSFQGDEADIIVASLVRNKPTGALDSATPIDINFIAQPDRLNVMLSRARRLLIIVGCWEYLSTCVKGTLSTTDPQGNYNDPDYGPFKKTLEELYTMFEDGRALKISAEDVLP